MVHGMASESDNRQLDNQQPQHSAEAFHAQLAAQPGSDRSGDARFGNMTSAQLADTRDSVNGTVLEMVGRQGQVSPAEFKVMTGAVDLGLRLHAFDPEKLQHLAGALKERAAEQNNPRAANGLNQLAEHLAKNSYA